MARSAATKESIRWGGILRGLVRHGARARQKVGARHARLRRASCAWLRSRRQEAALLTRPALRGLLEGSGRRASRIARAPRGFDSPAARRTKGILVIPAKAGIQIVPYRRAEPACISALRGNDR